MERFLSDERTLSWLTLGLATIGSITALVEIDGDDRFLLLAALLPFILRVVLPGFPAWAALVVTTVVVVIANIDGTAEGAFFLPIVAVLPVVATDPHRVRAYGLAAAAFWAPAAAWFLTGDEARDWTWPFWSMGVLLSTAFGAVVWRQRVLTGELLEARQQLTEQAILDERRWIAREVHDLVGHSLSVALLHVTGARHLLRRDLDEAEQALLEAERAGRENLAEIRRTVALLRDGGGFGTRPTPGVSDVADLVAEYRRGGLNVELAVQGPTARVDPVTGLAVYRVVQESLANVAKHAPGGRATVDIRVATDGTTLDVCNSVSGRPPVARAGGVGIVGMRERARAAGGDLQAGLTHGGWKVTAWLPNARDDGADPRPSEEAP